MHAQDAQGWILIISAISTAIISIITAWRVSKVHILVNSAASEQKAEIALLRSIVATKIMEASLAESARQSLASEAATAIVKAVPVIVTEVENSSIIKP